MQRSNLHLYFFLTTLEIALIGIPLMQLRSLETLEYSLPRLALLAVWLICFVICTWLTISILGQTTLSEKITSFIRSRISTVREWLVVLCLICWGGIALFFLWRDFLTFIWYSLPIIFEQYFLIVLIVGVWAVQSLIALRLVKPESQDENVVFPKAVQVFLVAFFFYTCTVVNLRISPYSKTDYFPELAQSFLQGRANLVNPPVTKDLTLFDGKYYVSFPPLGALIMLPFVALRGIQEFNIILFNVFFSTLGVTFTFLTLEAMKTRGLSQLPQWGHAALAFFLGFGTAQYSMTLNGLANFTSQILTTTFVAFSLWLVLSVRCNFHINALLAGCALGLAMLARPNVLFVWPAIAALQLQKLFDTENFSLRFYLQWIGLSLIPIMATLLGLFWYNQIRFGSPLDFGYTYMLVAEFLKNDLAKYGQFHPHFILENLRDNFLRLPYWDKICQMITFAPQGTSILFTSPLVVYIFSAIKKKHGSSALGFQLACSRYCMPYITTAARFKLDIASVLITCPSLLCC